MSYCHMIEKSHDCIAVHATTYSKNENKSFLITLYCATPETRMLASLEESLLRFSHFSLSSILSYESQTTSSSSSSLLLP